MPKNKKTQREDDFSFRDYGPRLTKQEVILNTAKGVYFKEPAQWVPDATGYILDPWQKDAINTLFTGKKGKVAVAAAHGCGKCRKHDDLMQLADGSVRKFSDLIGEHFEILSVDEGLNISRSRGLAENNGMKPCYRVTTQRGRKIEVTENHPLLHREVEFSPGKHPKWGEQYWKAAGELRQGDLVCVPDYLPINGDKPIEEWKVKILAYLIGDGHCRHRGATFSQSEGKSLDEVRQIVENLNLRLVQSKSNPCDYRISGDHKLNSNAVTNLIRETGLAGRRSGTMIFPDCIWTLPNEQLSIFLSRLFSMDGWVCLTKSGGKNNPQKVGTQIGYVSKSEQLVRDIHLACLRFGISGIIRKIVKHWTHKGVKKSNVYWEWSIAESHLIVKFLERIGIFAKEEACEKVREHVAREWDSNRNTKVSRKGEERAPSDRRALRWPYHELPEGFRWEKIAEVEYIGEQPTIAIHVPGDNTYLSTFVEHNTWLSAIITHLFICVYTPSRVAMSGPTGKQTRSQLWSYVDVVRDRSVFKDDLGWQKTRMFLKGKEEETFAVWLTSKEPKTIEGFHGPDKGANLLWIIEEAKGVNDAVFEAVQGALSSDNNFFYIASTCGGAAGFFFNTFHSLKNVWDTFIVPWHMSSHVSPAQVEKWRQTWGEDSPIFRARVLAEFPEEDERVIVPLPWLERAVMSDEEYSEAA